MDVPGNTLEDIWGYCLGMVWETLRRGEAKLKKDVLDEPGASWIDWQRSPGQEDNNLKYRNKEGMELWSQCQRGLESYLQPSISVCLSLTSLLGYKL
ncbi:hypothetical protein ACFLW0_05455 [Chloroflexota bacterium]